MSYAMLGKDNKDKEVFIFFSSCKLEKYLIPKHKTIYCKILFTDLLYAGMK